MSASAFVPARDCARCKAVSEHYAEPYNIENGRGFYGTQTHDDRCPWGKDAQAVAAFYHAYGRRITGPPAKPRKAAGPVKPPLVKLAKAHNHGDSEALGCGRAGLDPARTAKCPACKRTRPAILAWSPQAVDDYTYRSLLKRYRGA